MNGYTRAVFADTSFFYAAIDIEDNNHLQAKRLVEQVYDHGIAIISTWEIVVETVTLLRYRHGFAGSLAFLEEFLPRISIIIASAEEHAKALTIFRQRARQYALSLCDCLSFVIVTERLGHAPCLSFDIDFERLGLVVLTDLASSAGWVHERA